MSETNLILKEVGSNITVVDVKTKKTEASFSLYDDFGYLRAECAKRDLEGKSGKSANQMIAASNKEAARRNAPVVDFIHDDEVKHEDIPIERDYRDDDTQKGTIINCYFCGTGCLYDDDGITQDYEVLDSFHHCEDCMSNAIISNCL